MEELESYKSPLKLWFGNITKSYSQHTCMQMHHGQLKSLCSSLPLIFCIAYYLLTIQVCLSLCGKCILRKVTSFPSNFLSFYWSLTCWKSLERNTAICKGILFIYSSRLRTLKNCCQHLLALASFKSHIHYSPQSGVLFCYEVFSASIFCCSLNVQ